MKTLIACISLAAAMIGAANAGSRTIECRLVSVVRGGAPKEVFLDVSKGSGKRLMAMKPAASIDSAPVEISVSDDRPLRFYDGKGAEASLIGESGLPGDAESIVVLLLPAVEGEAIEANEGDGGAKWRIVALDFEPDGLKKGGVMILNGRASEAKVTLGEESRSLGFGESEVFTTPASKDEFNMVPLSIQVLDGSKWRSLKDGATHFVGEVSYWMILFEEPKVKRPQLRIYKMR